MLLSEQIIKMIDSIKNIIINSSENTLPDFYIKNNSILSTIYNDMSIQSIYFENDISYKEKVIIILDAIKDSLVNDTNTKAMKELVDFSSNIANGFKNAYDIINIDIKETIEDLIEAIKKETNELFKNNNLGNLLDDNLDVTSDHLKIFNWDGIKSPSVILDILNEISNTIKVLDDKVSKSNFDIIINDILKHTNNFIDIDKEEIQAIVNNDNKKILLSDNIDIFINKYNYKKVFSDFQRKLKDIKNIKDHIEYITLKSLEIKRFIKNLPKYKDSINAAIYDDIYNNSKIILHSVLCCQFCAAFYKETFFKDSILINKTLINGPLLEKYKKDNITKDVLAQYIRAFYLEKPLPMSGINISQINLSLIKNRLAEINTSIMAKKKIYRKRYLSIAFIKVMIDNTEDLYNTFNDKYININKEKAFKLFKDKVYFYKDRLYGDFGAVEKAIYEIIIELYFDDTIIDHIYDIFKDKLTNLLDQNNDIDDTDIVQLNLDVATDLIITFLKDNFIDEKI